MDEKHLRTEVIRLAHEKPELRKHLLPLLRQGAAKKLPTQFTYTIDMDERGEFRATVYAPGGKEVLEVNEETFEDGFMKNKNDLAGLADYLEDLKIGGPGTKVKKD